MSDININRSRISGLIPCAVQECEIKDVLIFAYMNQESFNLSIKTRFAHYFSRTRNRMLKNINKSKLIRC
ncbi:phosphoribosyl-AMP cyclohydrolase [Campylobacter pinnipediorum subsp. pinnipediorum]|uniref:phosphoribosyl-AMP cyclohydrolase n=1 Tax=Campylobacter pinnipediorum subsp. pinnipediorum TaxID=1660067 RepID=A0AAX0L905_9BACT|nr:phosphoribosyl-AMP cyclohydrolase [Campylobacter pinnipediorum]AQW81912.1 phosphoribosyl-AMP cyclohydrolase [Campylobacter pinnipediorum subsp. pinnipediorum]OPA75919.1 hypothetical protein BFG04_05625 [Campylobacter pinnipediorum subsp. pinnipediorum]